MVEVGEDDHSQAESEAEAQADLEAAARRMVLRAFFMA